MKKKIVILIAHLGNGGAERVSVNLANGLAIKGHEVHTVIFHRVKAEYELDHDVNIHYLERENNSKNSVVRKIIRLKKVLKEIEPDCVIELGFAIKYILVGGLINKYNYIFSFRNDPEMWKKNTKSIFKYFRNYYYGKARFIVFQTEDARNYFKPYIRKKGVIIPNMIKNDLPEAYKGDRKREVVTFCRLNKQKNLPLLIGAFAIFSQKHPDYLLKIYGRGEEETNLKAYAKEIGIDKKVEFCGFNSSVHESIRSSMMYVLSSDYEGLSNAMLEALAIGLPTICTDCPPGGARMFIKNGVNGFLTPVGDMDKMAARMCELAENENLRKQFTLEAVKIRNELSLENICNQWEKLIISI